jgi:hypothetical protein
MGLLAGIGMLAIPGVGPLIAAGPILATLAGVGAGGAVGGLVGALVGMGIPEYEAKRFEGAVKGGGTLLSVHCATSDLVTLAKRALKETGAQDIASSGEESSPHASSPKRTETETEYELKNAYLKSEAERGVVVAGPGTDEDLVTPGSADRSRHYPPS